MSLSTNHKGIDIEVSADDLRNYIKFADKLQEYPLYASTDGLCRADIVLLAKLSEYEFGNECALKVSVEIIG